MSSRIDQIDKEVNERERKAETKRDYPARRESGTKILTIFKRARPYKSAEI